MGLRNKKKVSLMIESVKESIAFKFTRLLKPQPPDKNLSNFLVVALDTEYRLPLSCPHNLDELKEKYGLTQLPPELTEPRPTFRTFQLACQGKAAHWKTDRQISSTELCSWILSNLGGWGIDFKGYKAIVVCCHYLLAEAQHLTDVRERFKSWGSSLYGEVDFKPDDWANFNPFSPNLEIKHDKIKFKFVDTYSLFGISLEKLTQESPYPKHKDEDVWHGKPWKWWRARPDKLFEEDEQTFWNYAENDVLALEWCVHYWRKWIWDRWRIDILRTKTFSGIGLRILKSKITEPLEPYIKESHLDKNYKPKVRITFDPTKKHVRDIFLDGYAAGRREVSERGFIAGPVYAYDVSKEYTTSAIMQPLPNAHTQFTEITDEDDLDRFEGMLEVRFEFPETAQYPCLPVIDERFPKQIYPLKGISVCGVAEVRLAKRLGAKVYIIRSCVFKPTQDEINHPIRQVLEEILALANEGKGTAQERFMKNIANGLIGKLFQRNKLEQKEQKWIETVTVASETSWSPILAALILSRARAIYSEILTLGTPVYGHTDSIFSRTPIDLDAPMNRELKKHGSEGLKLEAEFKRFWTPRAACYYGETKDGRIKTARHGIRGQEQDFIKAIGPRLGDLRASNRTVFVSLKMASFKDRNLDANLLGHELVTITDTDFEYDHKRKLLNPNANLWSESSKTEPWQSIDQLLETVQIKKDRRQRKLKEGFEQQETKRIGQVGRPKVVTDEDRTEMLRLIAQGWSRHKIARRFKDKYSQMTVYRSLPK